YDINGHPKVRRWDSAGEIAVTVPATNDGYLELEDGVQIKFDNNTYHTGDYWLIPARTVPGESGNVEWPQVGSSPQALARFGIVHHFCKLGLVSKDASSWDLVADCRPLFPPLTELISLLYVGGDGQETLPGQVLHYPLQVRVANGEHPVVGQTVKF